MISLMPAWLRGGKRIREREVWGRKG